MTAFISAEHDLSPVELSVLEEHLHSENRRLTGCGDDRGLAFVIRDGAGRAIAVAAGYSWAGTSELQLMWVDQAYRGLGYARQLLDAFVAEAASRGARRIWVSSHDFQAPGLYEKAGFQRVAEFAGWPEGHSNIVLRKIIAADGCA
ncbi:MULTISPECIES: GNAT family N-acetyltransferase [Mesorhizobium]|jgi:ribosomal protein S18 acetylase RimI-like enzyme|uniref:GCN5 family acetyltransferase n=1 Tax=Rhizobium loti TaxID=381 RepID=A0A6M7U2L4_RHILI|nr:MULTISPECIES: GNAT family N-acetyltransferase [Mesorhizobium]KRB22418.1 GCN5 family acetyltransferase [Mesorhizobium sp. Root172]OBQ62311.1 GCN5 family acetyltransferase [Mesorhizobium loti]QKC71385.1 N-acetyltransferase [Mesorhizobium loti]